LRDLHAPSLFRCRQIADERIRILALLERRYGALEAEHAALVAELEAAARPRRPAVERALQLRALRKRHENLQHVRRTRHAEMEALDARHRADLANVRAAHAEAQRDDGVRREREAFARRMRGRRPRYRCRPPNAIVGDGIATRERRREKVARIGNDLEAIAIGSITALEEDVEGGSAEAMDEAVEKENGPSAWQQTAGDAEDALDNETEPE
jgi:hypothetical protein